MENPKLQIVDGLKQANNVLVTVKSSPSVDQLSAAIGLTLLLNKMGKHGTAVFSGEVPSTIEFLEPEKTIEKNTDSLRDFIIALDKAKADKLRYKIEDSHVKIFITPYKASISEADLEFSQGDFNVDVVVALGVMDSKDFDQAITAQGRILHDAKVISISTEASPKLGVINWGDPTASSLSEMLFDLCQDLDKEVLDGQIATAFLTGIIAETDRFSNAKTSALTMAASAKLLAAGANQQLVATKLGGTLAQAGGDVEQKVDDKDGKQTPAKDQPASDGSININHGDATVEPDAEASKEPPEPDQPPLETIVIDEHGTFMKADELKVDQTPEPAPSAGTGGMIMTPPSLGGALAASAQATDDSNVDPLTSLPPATPIQPILTHNSAPAQSAAQVPDLPEPAEPAAAHLVAAPPDQAAQVEASLSDLQKTAAQPTVPPPADVSQARDAIQGVLSQTPTAPPLEPIAALNAQPINLNLGHDEPDPTIVTAPAAQALPIVEPAATIAPPTAPSEAPASPPPPIVPPVDMTNPTIVAPTDPAAPPPVPPPMMPPLPDLGNIQPPPTDPSQQPPQAF